MCILEINILFYGRILSTIQSSKKVPVLITGREVNIDVWDSWFWFKTLALP